jgi:small-conductance mechanosensitive channel
MNGSINFLFHLIGFGLLFTTLFAGWIIERKTKKESDWERKLYLTGIGRTFGILSPVAALILLLTGIVNIFNRYGGTTIEWYTQGWLVAKIILFAFLLVNGALLGPIIVRRRTKLLRTVVDKSATEDAGSAVAVLNKNIATFYLVQFLLLLIILYLSVAGNGKHPGII